MRIIIPALALTEATAFAQPGSPPDATGTALATEAPLHSGLVVGGALGIGTLVHGDVRLGWMITPRVALFAAGAKGVNPLAEDGVSYRLLGIGARLWLSERVFLDGRVGHAHARFYGVDASYTEDKTGVGYFAGAGVELLQSSDFGLELHADYIAAAGVTGLAAGLGLTFY